MDRFSKNGTYRLLNSLGVIGPDSIENYADCTRDKEHLQVYRCRASGVIFIDNVCNGVVDYERKVNTKGEIKIGDEWLKTPPTSDDRRRSRQFRDAISAKDWLDFGTGEGRILDLLKHDAKSVSGIEINKAKVEAMKSRGLTITTSIDDFERNTFDVMTFFHVLEHLPSPVEVLESAFSRLRRNGTLIVEVPHARDFLLQSLKCEQFKKFTLWSEHLILHTRSSLAALLEAANFTTFSIRGFQRYGFENHLRWLKEGRPGGHDVYAHLHDPEFAAHYSTYLERLDQTDTLIAVAKKT